MSGEQPVVSPIECAAHLPGDGHDVSLDALGVLGRRGGAWTPTLLTVRRDALSHTPLAIRQRDHYREALTEAGRLGVTVLAGTDRVVPARSPTRSHCSPRSG